MDAYLRVSLPDLIRIVRGDLTLGAALERERLQATSACGEGRWPSEWLDLSSLAAIRS